MGTEYIEFTEKYCRACPFWGVKCRGAGHKMDGFCPSQRAIDTLKKKEEVK